MSRLTLFMASGVLFVAACGAPTPPISPAPAAPGAQTVQQQQATSVEQATVAAAHSPAAQLVIDPQPAPQSGSVNVSGAGFRHGEPITISVSTDAGASSANLPLGTATTADDGSFEPVTLRLPDQVQSGAHAIDVAGQSSGRHATGTLWVRAPAPWLVMDSYDLQQYADFGLVAGGFEPLDQVDVLLSPASAADGAVSHLATMTTDQAGNGSWTPLKLPRLAAGSYALVLRSQASAAELRRDVHITPLKPTIELSPWAGPPGGTVQLNVRGFAPNEVVHTAVAGGQDAAALQADKDGNLWGAGPIRIPQQAAPGTLALTLHGDDSGASASADFKVLQPKPWLELTAWYGAPGAPVGFGGGGWIGGERIAIHLGSSSTPVETSGTADDGGWLKSVGQVYVPTTVDDDVVFVAVGEQSHLVATATFKVVFPFGLHPSQSPPTGGGATR